MPIYVQWKWKEQTKTFLLIFHFYDDYSKPNLRMKIEEYRTRECFDPPQVIPWMTWAPSHPEMGLLMELLSQANVLNGLKEHEKRELRSVLQGYGADALIELRNEMEEKRPSFSINLGVDSVTGQKHIAFELCPEYIDYLKKVLKPYFKD